MLDNFENNLSCFSADTLVRMYEELYNQSHFYSGHQVLTQLDKLVGRKEAVILISEYRDSIRSPHKLIG